MDANAMEQEAINHLLTVIKLLGPVIAPVVGAIAGLVIWAWKRMEKAQDKLEASITAHIVADDVIHDKLFTDVRELNSQMERVATFHETNHPGQRI